MTIAADDAPKQNAAPHPLGFWSFDRFYLRTLELAGALAAAAGLVSGFGTTPENALQQVVAALWIVCGVLGILIIAVAAGAVYVGKAIIAAHDGSPPVPPAH